MRDLPRPAQVFVGLVIAAGAAALAYGATHAAFAALPTFAALLVLSGAASAFKVTLPSTTGSATMSLSYAADFVALLLLGPHETTLIAAASAWVQCTIGQKTRNPRHRTLFSVAAAALTIQAAGWAYVALDGQPGDVQSLAHVARPLVAATTAYYLLNTGLLTLAIALSTGEGLRTFWREHFLWSAPSYYVGAAAAALVVWAVQQGGVWLATLALAPLLLIYQGYRLYLDRIEDERRHVQELADLHLATIEALALAIDAKDQTAQSHIRRVQVYAAGLARGLNMSETDIQGVKTAALLHDIGKLAVPEHILSKPGPLTQEEFQKIRIHPQVGAEIISAVPFPYPVAPLIHSHHERWDGKGYPQGLRGAEIPLGARILSVVDYFDALTSDRPYHKAMSHDGALTLLQQEAGRALDPAVVDLFIRTLPELAAEAERLEHAPGRRLNLEPANELGRPAVGFQHESGRSKVFDDIAHAHREIYALYEIAQSMGTSLGVADTMSLISSKLSNLVPFATCALFIYDEEADALKCRFSTGASAEAMAAMTLKSGHGLAGWVARNRRPLVNARPTADFEAASLPHPSDLLSAIVSPLVFNDRLIGTLTVYHGQPDFYTDDHRRLLDRVCEQASAVIHNATVFERTQEDSLTDPLTGLPNTRSMFIHLTRELARAARLRSEVALLVMDCDNFKSINDTHGHHVGDRALRGVAEVLRQTIRPYDICVRYAGDEFIVVLSGCGGEEAERKRQELKRAVDQLVFEVRPGRTMPLSISVGAAIFPHDGDTYEALLASADSRMYRDKARTKQRLTQVAPSPVHELSTLGLAATPHSLSDLEIQRARAGVL
jgi:diguanylate cyclase (GGDEF)-like protein/putative nucleotidyltransferase with HDIG domain